MKFGLLTYRNSTNLGDEIQSIAAQRLLPRVDVFLDRDLPEDSLGEAKGPIAVIMNGWYMHRPEGWPPPPSVVPLLISMHISQEVFRGQGKLGIRPEDYFVGKAGEYLKRWGPVGARDLNTMTLLQRHDIPSYFSGCLTLTLQRQENVDREDFVACVDLPPDLMAAVRQRTRRPIVSLSHLDPAGSTQERMRRAERLLALYQKAHCVITTRLHCALPCLAIETPVFLVDAATDQYRFEGLNLLMRHCGSREFIENRYNFDLETPAPNNLDYLKFRNSLIQRAQSFLADAPKLFKAKHFGAKETLRMRFDTLWAQYGEVKVAADLAVKKSQLLEGQLQDVVSKNDTATAAENARQREDAARAEESIAGLRRELALSGQTLAGSHNERERLLQALAASEETLARARAEAARLRETVAASEQVIPRFEQELASNAQNICELNLAKDKLLAKLADTSAEVVQLRDAVAASEQTASGLRDTVATSEQMASRLREEVALLQRRLSDLLADAARSQNTESELKRTLSDLNAAKLKAEREFRENQASLNRVILGMREQILMLNAEASAASDRLNLLIRSTSWKITAPLRMLGRRLPRVARLSQRILRPVWRKAYTALGRNEPMIMRSAGIERQMEQTLDNELFAVASPQADSGSSVENRPSPQSNIVAAFAGIQSKFGRNVFLVAGDAPPMHDKHAGGLRLYNLVRMFCEMGWRVVFASQSTLENFTFMAGSAADSKRYEGMLYDAGVEKIAYGAKECETLIRMLGPDLCWAFLSFPGVAKQFIPEVRMYAPWANIIYDMVDSHALRMSRQAQLTSDPALQAEADRMGVIELTNARTADVTVAVSEAERQALLDMDPNLVVEVIPPVFALPAETLPGIEGRSGLLFVGGFWHTPNVDAVLWFAQDVWPLILKQRPDIVFRVVGSNPSKDIMALRGQSGIEVLGYVPDLADLFALSRVSVAPMRYGAGVKGKVGQSMAYGLPVVATTIGAEGMSLENGEHLLVGDTADEFANAVLRLATDDDLWRRVQANGRRFVENHQSMDVVREKLRTFVNG